MSRAVGEKFAGFLEQLERSQIAVLHEVERVTEIVGMERRDRSVGRLRAAGVTLSPTVQAITDL